ncbi:MAG: hypothetical protein JXB17_07305 [Bacteroidales bacterium]|nr:hypothetical protein [Bacteroidales bacterium]
MRFIKLYFFIIFIVISLISTYSQKSKAQIKNVDFTYNSDNQIIVVIYDIDNSSAIERYNIELTFVDFNGNRIVPRSIRGDVGNDIKGGKNKVIYWDVLNDVEELGRVRARVTVKGVTEHLGNSSNALLSVMVPGLGDYYVKNKRNMIIKPVFRTITAYGLVGYGIYNYIDFNKKFKEYNDKDTPREDFDRLFNEATTSLHRSYVASSIGAAIWASDVIWVAIKGAKNKQRNLMIGSIGYDYNLVYIPGGVGLNLSVKF